MNRRDFLKIFPSLAATLIPTSFAVAAPEIKNTKDLTDYLEKAFMCSMGSPGPYITEELNNDHSNGKTENLSPEYRYSTLMYCSVGDDKVLEERRLAQYFYKKLNPMKGHELIWRVKPEFDSKEIYEFGEVFMTKEEFEDSYYWTGTGENVTKHKLELPENVAYDFDTDKYRYYDKKYWLHRIRMRIAIPEAHQQLAQIDLSEGARAQRIA